MEALSRINIAIVALLSFGLLACDGYDGDDDEEEEESASLEQVLGISTKIRESPMRSDNCS